MAMNREVLHTEMGLLAMFIRSIRCLFIIITIATVIVTSLAIIITSQIFTNFINPFLQLILKNYPAFLVDCFTFKNKSESIAMGFFFSLFQVTPINIFFQPSSFRVFLSYAKVKTFRESLVCSLQRIVQRIDELYLPQQISLDNVSLTGQV